MRTRVPLEDIYRLSVEAEKPAELVLKAARSGPDELAAAMRALDGKPYRGFALLYAAQKAAPLVGVDPRKALDLARAIHDEAASLAEANREARATTPAPRQAIQAESHLLESQALVMMGDAMAARAAVTHARALFVEAGDLGFGAALCDYFEGRSGDVRPRLRGGRDAAPGRPQVLRGIRPGPFPRAIRKPRSETILRATGSSTKKRSSTSTRAVAHFGPGEGRARAHGMTLNNRGELPGSALALRRRARDIRARRS